VTVRHKKSGSAERPHVPSSENYFSVEPAPDPELVQAANVTFEPGARAVWHAHPLGQTLIVTAECGWAQREGR